jgi:Fe2+ or Zn2+ uptake regulation protein
MSDMSVKRQVTYGALLIAALAASAYCISVMFKAPISEMPNTQEEAQLFVCSKCGAAANLTPRQVATGMGEAAAKAETERTGSTSIRKLVLICAQCKELSLTRGRECPKCKTPFALITPDGEHHIMCPACEKLEPAPQQKLPTD